MTLANDPINPCDVFTTGPEGPDGISIGTHKQVTGLSKRELFAAMAMEGVLIGMFGERPTARPAPSKVAAHAVAFADALIIELTEIKSK